MSPAKMTVSAAYEKAMRIVNEHEFHTSLTLDEFAALVNAQEGVTRNVKFQVSCKRGHTRIFSLKDMSNIHACFECERDTLKYAKVVKEVTEFGYKYVLSFEEYCKLEDKLNLSAFCENKHEKIFRSNDVGHTLKYNCSHCKRGDNYDTICTLFKNRGYTMITSREEYNSERVRAQCKDGHDFSIVPSRARAGFGCPNCHQSRGEMLCKFVFEQLTGCLFDKIRHPLIVRKQKPLELDGYNRELNIAFEYNGEQHYQELWCKHSFEEIQLNDAFKMAKCVELNISLLVIPYTVNVNDIPKFIHDWLVIKNPAIIKMTPDKIDLSGIAMNSYTERIEEFVKEHKLVWKAGRPVKSDSMLTFVCSKGHEYTKTYSLLIRARTSCPICAVGGTVEEKLNRTEKTCTQCNVIKPLEQFYTASNHIDGYDIYCKPCRNAFTVNNQRKVRTEQCVKEGKEVPLTLEQVRERNATRTEKPCNKCGVVKPKTKQYFCLNKDSIDGFNFRCRACSNNGKEPKKPNLTLEEKQRLTEKPCNKCKVVKPIDEFTFRTGDGIRVGKCKECSNKDQKAQRERRLKKAIEKEAAPAQIEVKTE